MAHDLKSICDNLAAKFLAVSQPSGTPAAIKAAFGQEPTGIPNTPAVYIEVDDGEIILGNGTWDVTHNVIVNFLLAKAPGDPNRVDRWRQLWLVPLLQATFGDGDLSATGVKSALPEKYEFAEIIVGGEPFDGIRIFYAVRVKSEAVSYSA